MNEIESSSRGNVPYSFVELIISSMNVKRILFPRKEQIIHVTNYESTTKFKLRVCPKCSPVNMEHGRTEGRADE